MAAGSARPARIPFSLFERQRITAKDRYRKLVDQLQYIARRELIFGMHVHVGRRRPGEGDPGRERADRPPAEFLALSASSPFWRGEPTGLASSRQMVFSAFPRSGIPPRFASYEEFAEVVGQLERTGCIADYTHIWWDLRPHPRLGTIELRICDAVTRVEDAVALAAYFQALVKMLSEHVETIGTAPSYHRMLTTENKWLAARYGLSRAGDRPRDRAAQPGARSPSSCAARCATSSRTRASSAPSASSRAIAEILARGNGADGAAPRLEREPRHRRGGARALGGDRSGRTYLKSALRCG